ncbi:hypothetical protein [Vibrio hippocampi]|uniref:Lipoprotein n=1 Tax=Vibrio hippocampi TaxID=654686 RepID=A0ABM8ZGC0_9VIBR|nr:hypothetical protein [Vibrio hippocampi]CAH0525685.1 hypothetical protein VHP8226_01215 [Vibrio hippocampi]
MKTPIFAILVSASLILTGCSSSNDSTGSNPSTPVLPDLDDSPQWGLDFGDTPDWGIVDPDFGIPDTENTPDRLPPVWGGPEMPPIDNGPEAAYTISGNTITDAHGNTYLISDVDWHGQTMVVLDKEGNEYHVSIIRQGEFEGDFGIIINGESIIIGGDALQGGLRPMMEGSQPSIDRNSIRDSIRARLN